MLKFDLKPIIVVLNNDGCELFLLHIRLPRS